MPSGFRFFLILAFLASLIFGCMKWFEHDGREAVLVPAGAARPDSGLAANQPPARNETAGPAAVRIGPSLALAATGESAPKNDPPSLEFEPGAMTRSALEPRRDGPEAKARSVAAADLASPPKICPWRDPFEGGEPGLKGKSLLVVGDSFAVGVGLLLAERLRPLPDVALVQKGKVSSGLNTPWFYDWSTNLELFIKSEKPDALVVMIGGNDSHNGSGSRSWAEDYRQKVRDFLRIAAGRGIKVYWAGLPPMGKKSFCKRAKVADKAMRDACSEYSNCRFVDAWSLFSDESGEYVRRKKIGKKTVTLRAGDGVHLTTVGNRLLAGLILEAISPGGLPGK